MQTIYAGTVGFTISLALLNPDGSTVNLTGNSSVVVSLYGFGTGTLLFSGTATVDSATGGLAHYNTTAGQLATAGNYYSEVVVTYAGGNILKFADQNYIIVASPGQINEVTVEDLLKFMNIVPENAIASESILMYLAQAQNELYTQAPGVVNLTDSKFIQLKAETIRLRAAVHYFMNLSENNVNPDVRLGKIKMWNELYKNNVDTFMSVLTSTANTPGAGVVLRVTNDVCIPSNPLQQTYNPTQS